MFLLYPPTFNYYVHNKIQSPINEKKKKTYSKKS